jgi:hypothetical protein
MAVVAEEYVQMAKEDVEAETPTTLYHTVLTVTDLEADPTGSVRSVYPLGTHTALPSAKAFSRLALGLLGYDKTDFELYDERKEGDESWTHGDGTLVYARRTGPHEFVVGIVTTPNNENLPQSKDGHAHVQLPDGSDHLHYVLQTRVDYHLDRSGQVQTTEIEGTYAHRKDAMAAARSCLLSDEISKSDFAQYDELGDSDLRDEWPFGEDVFVHAVAQTGENYSVAVRTVLGSHAKHSKKQEKKN